mgnify:CR=1 FL=1
MAIKFDYKSGFDTLMNEVIPHYVNKRIDRQESSRRFDAQMLADSDKTDQAQENFDRSFELQENQLKEAKEDRDYKQTFEEEKLFLTELTDVKSIAGKLNIIDKLKEKDEQGNFTGNYSGLTSPAIIRSVNSKETKLLSQQKSNQAFIDDFTSKDSILGGLLATEADKDNPDFNKVYLQHLTANNVSNATSGQIVMKAFGEAGINYRKQQEITELSPTDDNQAILLNLKSNYDRLSSKVDTFIENNSTMGSGLSGTSNYKGTYEDPVVITEGMVKDGLPGIGIGKIVQFENQKTKETITGVVESIDENGAPVIVKATTDPIYNQDTTAQLFEGISKMEITAPPKEESEIPALYQGRPITSSVVNTLMSRRYATSKIPGRAKDSMWLDDFAKLVLGDESATGSSLQTKKGKKALMEYNKNLKR